MTSDSADLESNSALSDADSQSNLSRIELNSILPDAELNSVLQYLKTHSATSKLHNSEDEVNSIPNNVESNLEHPDEEVNSAPADEVANLETLDGDANSPSTEAITNSENSEGETNAVTPEAIANLENPERETNAVTPEAIANSENSEGKTNAVTPEAIANAENPDKAENSAIMSDLDSISTLSDLDDLESPSPDNKAKNDLQVQWKTEEGRLLLILPTEAQVPAAEFNWYEIWQQMRQRLQADRFRVPNTPVHLLAKDRLLDSRQLQELAEVLNEIQLQLKSVATSRRQTAIAAVSSGYSVEQLPLETSLSSEPKVVPTPLADALYLEMTVRSGVEIRHAGSVIILGDLNPGGIVVADGDILVWGRLRGIAHAGASGNRECLIMSLQMEPTQLRIADAVARAPEKSPTQFSPEVAHMTSQGIRIARAIDFSRSQLNRMNLEP
ncbi:septum site-determining protein MinC [Tolypothrix sp. PCC 7601]|nr:septum site-determining protein MinC [Tolypothrix sp. PCC 7601]BAY94307.1 septum site-determining protein MinC [Microchaete diplosiphon NIES-3275]